MYIESMHEQNFSLPLSCSLPTNLDEYPRMSGYPRISTNQLETESRRTIVFECSVPTATSTTSTAADDEYEVQWLRNNQLFNANSATRVGRSVSSVTTTIDDLFNGRENSKLGFHVSDILKSINYKADSDNPGFRLDAKFAPDLSASQNGQPGGRATASLQDYRYKHMHCHALEGPNIL